MLKSDFENSPAGRVVSTERNQWAFVPTPLPPSSIDLASISPILAEASQVLGELNGIARMLRNPYLLISPLQVREAISSSSMEGTYTTVDQFMLMEAGARNLDESQDTREVLNYRRALSAAIRSLDEVPLSLRTLRDAHRMLLDGVKRHRGLRAQPGEFKSAQNYIGAYDIEKARFIPPPPDEAKSCLSELERYIHRDNSENIPLLVDCALVHYQFETIHPFADGNGRVGRMLATLHLYAKDGIRQPVVYLSPAIEKRKDEYIDRMYAVSREGAWTPWLQFFLEIIRDSCADTVATAGRLLDLQEEFRNRMQQARASANVLSVVDRLFQHPVFSIPEIAIYLGVTYRAAQQNIEKLLQAGLITEIENTNNPKFFAAPDVIRLSHGG